MKPTFLAKLFCLMILFCCGINTTCYAQVPTPGGGMEAADPVCENDLQNNIAAAKDVVDDFLDRIMQAETDLDNLRIDLFSAYFEAYIDILVDNAPNCNIGCDELDELNNFYRAITNLFLTPAYNSLRLAELEALEASDKLEDACDLLEEGNCNDAQDQLDDAAECFAESYLHFMDAEQDYNTLMIGLEILLDWGGF